MEKVECEFNLGKDFIPKIERKIGMCSCLRGNDMASSIFYGAFSFVGTMSVGWDILECDVFAFKIFFKE